MEVTGGPKAGLETAHSAMQGDNKRVWPSPAGGKDGVGVGAVGVCASDSVVEKGWGTLKPWAASQSKTPNLRLSQAFRGHYQMYFTVSLYITSI